MKDGGNRKKILRRSVPVDIAAASSSLFLPPTQRETCRDVQDGGLLMGRRRCEAARRNGSLRGIGERD